MARRKAYTLMELAMVAVVVAIIVAAAVGGTDNGRKQQGNYAGEDFETDVAYARNLSIARPDDPVVIKVDTAANKYWLAKASAPDTPIALPQSGQPYVRQFGSTGKSSYQYVSIAGYDFGGDAVLKFDGTGTTDQPTSAVLQFTSDGAQYEVSVAPASAQTATNIGFTKTVASTGVATLAAE